MTGDPTVLGMINDRLGSIDTEQKKIAESVHNLETTSAVDSNRLDHMEGDIEDLKNGQKKIKKSLWDHISGPDGKKKHYNQGYTETFGQKTWRRKDLIALMTIIFGSITWLSQNWPF